MDWQKIENEHKHMISNPELWPRWPILPLIRGRNELELGVIFAPEVSETSIIVRFGNLFSLPSSFKEFENMKSIVYDSVEEVVADGWTVD